MGQSQCSDTTRTSAGCVWGVDVGFWTPSRPRGRRRSASRTATSSRRIFMLCGSHESKSTLTMFFRGPSSKGIVSEPTVRSLSTILIRPAEYGSDRVCRSATPPLQRGKWMLRVGHEVLCASRRNRILLVLAATLIPLVIILVLLEISYREEVAREVSLTFTGSLLSSPPVDHARISFEPGYPRWTPLARPIVPLAPPPPTAVAQPSSTQPSQRPAQGAVARNPVPLPRSRPDRF